MGHRLSKIYTRTGDDGLTQVEAKHRISKDSSLIEALGTLDETNSAIGLLLANDIPRKDLKDCLTQIQHDLFNLGGELCPPHHVCITQEKISQLETFIDDWNKELPPLKEFILPRGDLRTASCHLARTICRRAERCLVSLHHEAAINPNILAYINRLSDLLFVAARLLSKHDLHSEILWENNAKP